MLHKVEVFKHSNCYDLFIPPCTELMQNTVLSPTDLPEMNAFSIIGSLTCDGPLC